MSTRTPKVPVPVSRPAPAEAELASLCEKQVPFLQLFLLSRGARPDDVQDLIQQVFAVFWERRGSVLPGKAPAFLTGIARNTLLAYKRKQQVRRAIENAHLGAIVEALHSETPPPGHSLLQHERRQELGRLIGRLSPRMGEIVRMLYLDGRPRSEVAKALGITRQTLSVAERRGLIRLGDLLREGANRWPDSPE